MQNISRFKSMDEQIPQNYIGENKQVEELKSTCQVKANNTNGPKKTGADPGDLINNSTNIQEKIQGQQQVKNSANQQLQLNIPGKNGAKPILKNNSQLIDNKEVNLEHTDKVLTQEMAFKATVNYLMQGDFSDLSTMLGHSKQLYNIIRETALKTAQAKHKKEVGAQDLQDAKEALFKTYFEQLPSEQRINLLNVFQSQNFKDIMGQLRKFSNDLGECAEADFYYGKYPQDTMFGYVKDLHNIYGSLLTVMVDKNEYHFYRLDNNNNPVPVNTPLEQEEKLDLLAEEIGQEENNVADEYLPLYREQFETLQKAIFIEAKQEFDNLLSLEISSFKDVDEHTTPMGFISKFLNKCNDFRVKTNIFELTTLMRSHLREQIKLGQKAPDFSEVHNLFGTKEFENFKDDLIVISNFCQEYSDPETKISNNKDFSEILTKIYDYGMAGIPPFANYMGNFYDYTTNREIKVTKDNLAKIKNNFSFKKLFKDIARTEKRLEGAFKLTGYIDPSTAHPKDMDLNYLLENYQQNFVNNEFDTIEDYFSLLKKIDATLHYMADKKQDDNSGYEYDIEDHSKFIDNALSEFFSDLSAQERVKLLNTLKIPKFVQMQGELHLLAKDYGPKNDSYTYSNLGRQILNKIILSSDNLVTALTTTMVKNKEISKTEADSINEQYHKCAPSFDEQHLNDLQAIEDDISNTARNTINDTINSGLKQFLPSDDNINLSAFFKNLSPHYDLFEVLRPDAQSPIKSYFSEISDELHKNLKPEDSFQLSKSVAIFTNESYSDTIKLLQTTAENLDEISKISDFSNLTQTQIDSISSAANSLNSLYIDSFIDLSYQQLEFMHMVQLNHTPKDFINFIKECSDSKLSRLCTKTVNILKEAKKTALGTQAKLLLDPLVKNSCNNGDQISEAIKNVRGNFGNTLEDITMANDFINNYIQKIPESELLFIEKASPNTTEIAQEILFKILTDKSSGPKRLDNIMELYKLVTNYAKDTKALFKEAFGSITEQDRKSLLNLFTSQDFIDLRGAISKLMGDGDNTNAKYLQNINDFIQNMTDSLSVILSDKNELLPELQNGIPGSQALSQKSLRQIKNHISSVLCKNTDRQFNEVFDVLGSVDADSTLASFVSALYIKAMAANDTIALWGNDFSLFLAEFSRQLPDKIKNLPESQLENLINLLQNETAYKNLEIQLNKSNEQMDTFVASVLPKISHNIIAANFGNNLVEILQNNPHDEAGLNKILTAARDYFGPDNQSAYFDWLSDVVTDNFAHIDYSSLDTLCQLHPESDDAYKLLLKFNNLDPDKEGGIIVGQFKQTAATNKLFSSQEFGALAKIGHFLIGLLKAIFTLDFTNWHNITEDDLLDKIKNYTRENGQQLQLLLNSQDISKDMLTELITQLARAENPQLSREDSQSLAKLLVEAMQKEGKKVNS